MKTDLVQAHDVKLQYFEHGSGPEVLVLVHGYRSSGRIWQLMGRIPIFPVVGSLGRDKVPQIVDTPSSDQTRSQDDEQRSGEELH